MLYDDIYLLILGFYDEVDYFFYFWGFCCVELVAYLKWFVSIYEFYTRIRELVIIIKFYLYIIN